MYNPTALIADDPIYLGCLKIHFNPSVIASYKFKIKASINPYSIIYPNENPYVVRSKEIQLGVIANIEDLPDFTPYNRTIGLGSGYSQLYIRSIGATSTGDRISFYQWRLDEYEDLAEMYGEFHYEPGKEQPIFNDHTCFYDDDFKEGTCYNDDKRLSSDIR
jgi:hypothetical protein